MSEIHKQSAIKRWSTISKAIKSLHGTMMATAKHAKMTDKQRSEHAKMMNSAKHKDKLLK